MTEDLPLGGPSRAQEQMGVVRQLRTLKETYADRTTSLAVITTIASDVMGDATRNNAHINSSTDEMLTRREKRDADAKANGKKVKVSAARLKFEENAVDNAQRLANANIGIAESMPKTLDRMY